MSSTDALGVNVAVQNFEAMRKVLLEKIFQVTGVVLESEESAEDSADQETSESLTPTEVTIPGAYDLVVIGASTRCAAPSNLGR